MTQGTCLGAEGDTVRGPAEKGGRVGGEHSRVRVLNHPDHPATGLLEIAVSRDSAPLSQDSFRTWRVATTCFSTPPHAINTSTHQRNCRHYFRVLLGISSISAYITRLLCCVQPKVKTPHRTPAVAPSRGTGTSHPLPGDRQLPIIESRQWLQTLSYLPGGSAWAQGQRLLPRREVSAGLRSPCLFGCPSGQGGVDNSHSTHSFTSFAVGANLSHDGPSTEQSQGCSSIFKEKPGRVGSCVECTGHCRHRGSTFRHLLLN